MSNSQGLQAVIDPGIFLSIYNSNHVSFRNDFFGMAWRANYSKGDWEWDIS